MQSWSGDFAQKYLVKLVPKTARIILDSLMRPLYTTLAVAGSGGGFAL